MPPKVSICIPAYKSPDLLERALRSVLMQTYPDYEVIVTDDTPDDSVANLVKRQSDGRIRYFSNRPALGSPENWNEGIRRASGEYIKVLHHDDCFSDEHSLSEYVRLLEEHTACDFAFSACTDVNYAAGKETLHRPSEEELALLRKNPYSLFPANFIGAPSVTFYRNRKDFLYDARIKYVVDIEFYIRVLAANPNFVYSEKPLVRINTGSEFQVTAACISDRTNELTEWFYLFDLIRRKTRPSRAQMHYMIFLLRKHGVKSSKALAEETGLDIGLPLEIQWDFLKRKLRALLRPGDAR